MPTETLISLIIFLVVVVCGVTVFLWYDNRKWRQLNKQYRKRYNKKYRRHN